MDDQLAHASPLGLPEPEALENHIEEQALRLRLLEEQGAGWLERWRQSRKVHAANKDLEWLTTRAFGKAHYVWRHGVLRYGILLSTTIVAGVLVKAGKIPNLQGSIALLTIAVFEGLLIGVGKGRFEWGRAESHLSKTLASLQSSASGSQSGA